jgi:glycosyltransferase involved in cell wall biosynthesis
MNILMIVRSNLYTSAGGDTTQIDMTATHLRKLGVGVDIVLSNEVKNLEGYDLLHFFNIIRPDDILPFINTGRIPFVVSTIFVDYTEYERNNRSGTLGFLFRQLSSGQVEYCKAVARWVFNGDRLQSGYYILNGHRASMKKVVQQSRLLLPNSHSEYQRLESYLQEPAPYRKVVNAIDSALFKDDVVENSTYKNHVLCVGRIEGRKNQLNLIKALMNTPVQLTIIGKASPNHSGYFDACKTLAATANNILFIEHLSHKELVSIYKAAKVHVLPSWFETTGLSSLEAGVMDCNIVVTKKGDTTEYFEDMAYYCEPDEVESIRDCVMQAYNAPVNPNLKTYILQHYSWERTAEQTLLAYNEVLSIA